MEVLRRNELIYQTMMKCFKSNNCDRRSKGALEMVILKGVTTPTHRHPPPPTQNIPCHGSRRRGA